MLIRLYFYLNTHAICIHTCKVIKSTAAVFLDIVRY